MKYQTLIYVVYHLSAGVRFARVYWFATYFKPIHVIKKYIYHLLSVLYHKCINDGIFANELKVGKISQIGKISPMTAGSVQHTASCQRL